MMGSFKKNWAEFREFAFKGNMIDLAIAVVIGAAFAGVIHALVDDIIMPAVGYVVMGVQTASTVASDVAKKAESTVGIATKPSTEPSTQPAATMKTTPPPAPIAPTPPAAAAPPDNKAVHFDLMIGQFKVGDFIGELLNFLIIAFAVFLIMVKVLGSVVKRVSKPAGPSEPTTRECPFCLSNIPIKAKKCAHCTADLPAVV